MRLALTVAAVAMGVGAYANAAPLLQWDFAGSNGNVATAAATTVDANLQSSTLARGAGLPAGACSFHPEYGSFTTDIGSAPGTLAGAITGNAYFQFAATPQAGVSLSLSSLDFAGWQQNTHAAATVDVQYSLDGFATAGTSAGSVAAIHDGWTGDAYSVDLSSIGALQGASQAVTFRLYYYGFGGWEQRGLGQINGANIDLGLNGTASPVPEPAILGVLASSGLLLTRRRK